MFETKELWRQLHDAVDEYTAIRRSESYEKGPTEAMFLQNIARCVLAPGTKVTCSGQPPEAALTQGDVIEAVSQIIRERGRADDSSRSAWSEGAFHRTQAIRDRVNDAFDWYFRK